MQRALLYIFLFFFLYSCGSANDHFRQAVKEIEKKNYRKAIDHLNKAIAKKKDFSKAYAEKGYCYSQLKRHDSAIIVYDQLLSFHSNNTWALFNVGLCKYDLEKFDEAINYFDRAMASKGYDPNDSSKFKLTFELTPLGKELLDDQNIFDIPFSEIFYMAGLTHYELGKNDKAYSYFKNCISRGYKLGESHYMIALCWLSSNEKEKACTSFKESSMKGYALATEQLAKNCQ